MSSRISIPAYTGGTIVVANISGTWTATGSGTNFLSPEGLDNWTIAVGDMFVVPNIGFGTVASIVSSTVLTLDMWSGAAVTSASSYKIYRLLGAPSSALIARLTQLLALGTDASPDAALVIDAGTSRIKFDFDASGNPRIRARQSAAADSAYVTLISWSPTSGSIISSTILKTFSGTLSALNSIATATSAGAGAKAIITDSSATFAAGIGNIASGGGSNIAPVYSDGTNWRLG